MKNKDIIKLLQEYPDDAEVSVFGAVEYNYVCEEYKYLNNIQLYFDKDYNELMIEGSDQFKIIK